MREKKELRPPSEVTRLCVLHQSPNVPLTNTHNRVSLLSSLSFKRKQEQIFASGSCATPSTRVRNIRESTI